MARAVLFCVSLFCISLELFFTRILNLKTWNHIVYIIIPFAILGFGVGANFYLILGNKIKASRNDLVAACLFLLAGLSVLVTQGLIHLPVGAANLMDSFHSLRAGLALSLAYTLVAVPFVVIGFVVVYFFMEDSKETGRLYFWNLAGSGAGAAVFFLLINHLQVFHSILLLCLMLIVLGAAYLQRDKRWLAGLLALACSAGLWMPEPSEYAIDAKKGWEWIPGYFTEKQYEKVLSRWHPYGRTDAYRFLDPVARELLYANQPITFNINLAPAPEFVYFCTNFLAGSPVYNLSPEGMRRYGVKVVPFSQEVEFAYTLLNQPKVVVIGTGGGRDIFMAKIHGAREVIGAEINPVIHAEMSEGGALYDYSGRVYGLDGVKVYNVDGRHLVKCLPASSQDFVVLNGVDTFSGLSTGAYAYAESYLYTKEAVQDYLRILRPNGMINFNRWFFFRKPRETLRLFAICLEALRATGAERPWDHIMVGFRAGWGMTLVKKEPFTKEERTKISDYFSGHGTGLVFPRPSWNDNDPSTMNFFELYAWVFAKEREDEFVQNYPYDISVVTDDNPFFYKYYRLDDLLRSIRTKEFGVIYNGMLIFVVQGLVLLYALGFILLAVGVPLFLFKRQGMRALPEGCTGSFVTYFACLGVGFMFIEIAAMQKFTLLLGNPIHSISVTLAALLIFSGLGSLSVSRLEKAFKNRLRLLQVAAVAVAAYLIAWVGVGARVLDAFMGLAFAWRMLLIAGFLFPIGFCLGIFFPTGLQVVSTYSKETIAWAFGINCGFTVLGSMLAVILAQFWGFNLTLLLAALAYLIAPMALRKLAA